MATIAVLAAKLQVDGAETYGAEIEKAKRKTDELSNSVNRLGQEYGKVERHQNVAMRGASAFTANLKSVNAAAYGASSSLAAAGASAGSLKNTLQGAAQAARGFGGALGGLGSLSPVISAIASPAGLAAAAIGGMVLVIKKLRDEIAELDAMNGAGVIEELARAAAGQDAASKSFLTGIAAGKSGVELDLIVQQAEKMGEFNFELTKAAKSADDLRAEQKKLREQIAPDVALVEGYSKKLKELTDSGNGSATEIFHLEQAIAGLNNKLAPSLSRLANIPNEIRNGFGAIRTHAEEAGKATKTLSDIVSGEAFGPPVDLFADHMRKAADQAKRLREEMEKVRDAAQDTLADVARSLSASMSVGSSPPPNDWKGAGAPGTAMGYGSIMGDIGKAGADIGQAVADSIIERTASLKNQAIGMLPGLSGGVAASAANGPAGIGMALLQASKGFQDTMERVNALLQLFADAIGETLRPAIPLLEQITELLRPLAGSLAAIAPLVTELNPAFMLLSVGTRVLADTVERVVHVFSQSILGVLRAIRKALHKLGGATWKPLDNAIDSLKKSLKGLDKTSQQLAETFGTILPEGYKLLELRRYQSTPGITTYYGPTGVGTGGGLTAGGNSATSGGVVVQGNIELHGIQDVPSLARALAGERRWRGTVRTGRASYSSGSA